jgi:ParB/RepB/Spo0J family partition protein
VELELGQIDTRYDALRGRSPTRERRVLASIADVGQQVPVVVVRDADRFVLVDGYKRVRALGRLGRDLVVAVGWDLAEADALLLERVLRSGDADNALEQGWFLHELTSRFGLSCDELARRFDRTPSWVSRRLALVSALPKSVQEHVRTGAIGAHAAMKYLVPLARANAADCTRLCEGLAGARPTSRQVADLYAAYTTGNARSRDLVVSAPLVALRARLEAARASEADKTPVEHLLADLSILAAVARRAHHRMRRGSLDGATSEERQRVMAACGEARAEIEVLGRRCEKETVDAG